MSQPVSIWHNVNIEGVGPLNASEHTKTFFCQLFYYFFLKFTKRHFFQDFSHSFVLMFSSYVIFFFTIKQFQISVTHDFCSMYIQNAGFHGCKTFQKPKKQKQKRVKKNSSVIWLFNYFLLFSQEDFMINQCKLKLKKNIARELDFQACDI